MTDNTFDHIGDELPLLLTGEADRATVAAAARHLRDCGDCRDELVAAVTAHASLSSAARFAPSLVRPVDDEPIHHDRIDDEPIEDEPIEDLPLPDLSSVFAQVRAEASAKAPERPRKRSPWLLAAAAVVGVAVGGGGVAVGAQLSGSDQSHQNIALAAFDKGTVPATVKVVGGDQMKLDATSLPSPGAGKVYEVWLTNAARTQMYAVGSLAADQRGSFTVAGGLMGTYSAIEVSVQPLNDSAFSGVSVLRGTYA